MELNVRGLLLMLSVLVATACGPPSIESLCEDAAQGQCEACYSCQEDGADLCRMPAGFDQAECQEDLVQRCVDQATTLERPKREIDGCAESLDEVTCSSLRNADAQNTPYTTDECAYFL